MTLDNQLIAYVALALLAALVISFLMTPVVRTFAYKVGGLTAVGRGVFEGEELLIGNESVVPGEGMYEEILKKLEGR